MIKNVKVFRMVSNVRRYDECILFLSIDHAKMCHNSLLQINAILLTLYLLNNKSIHHQFSYVIVLLL